MNIITLPVEREVYDAFMRGYATVTIVTPERGTDHDQVIEYRMRRSPTTARLGDRMARDLGVVPYRQAFERVTPPASISHRSLEREWRATSITALALLAQLANGAGWLMPVDWRITSTVVSCLLIAIAVLAWRPLGR